VWLGVGTGFLNLDNVVHSGFVRDNDGALVAGVELLAGQVKQYRGQEAEHLK
jgi:hypothetical protein